MIGDPMKLLTTVAVTGMCLCSCLTARASHPVVCSAFSERGDAVTVTFVEPNLSLQITPPGSGKPLELSTVTNDDGLVSCSIFFDGEDHYVAVGLNDLRLTPGPLFIVVADLATGKLMGNFSVPPSAGTGESLKLVGFLRNGPNLVVLGSGAPNHPTKSFTTTVFRVTGEQENTPEIRTVPENTEGVGNTSLVDAAHNRLWFKSKPQFCPLRSIPLVGGGPEGLKVDGVNARPACDATFAIAYPSESALITAVTRQPSDLVTRVDLRQHSAEQLALSATGGHGSYTAVGRGVLSPDGQVFAVSRNLLSNSFSGDSHSHGTEVDVVQVSPLKFVGKVRLKPDTDSASISIDHRSGSVTVFYFEDGKWKSEHLKVVAQAKSKDGPAPTRKR